MGATRIEDLDNEVRAALVALNELRFRDTRTHLEAARLYSQPLAAIARDDRPTWADSLWPKGYTCPKCSGTQVHAQDCSIVIERGRGG